MFDRKKHNQELRKQRPIAPGDEFIVMFEENVAPQQVRKTLTDVFNRHHRGKIGIALPGSTTLLISNIDWDIVEELQRTPGIRAIGPNRKIDPC